MLAGHRKSFPISGCVLLVYGLFCGLSTWLPAQALNSPFLDVYPKEVYGYGAPNWSIQQSKNGLVYAANNEGLLEYDGYQWTLFPLSNRTIVRDILLRGDSIFAGGQNEFGYYRKDSQLKWSFVSLRAKIPQAHRQFEDVWNLVAFGDKLCFRSSNKLFLFEGDTCEVLDDEDYLFLGQIDSSLLIHTKSGKLLLKNEHQTTLLSDAAPLKSLLIRSVVQSGQDTLLATYKQGIWQLKKGVLQQWKAGDQQIRDLAFINNLQRFPDGSLGISTNFAGFFQTDPQGNIIRQLDKNNGLSSSGVIVSYSDQQGNLWLGLENGLALLHLQDPIQEIDLTKADFGPAYDLAVHEGYIYVGTNKGLFRSPLQTGFSAQSLDLIPGTEGQVWGLDVIGERLLMSHNDGLFLISGAEATPLITEFGTWQVLPFNGSSDSLIVGSYQGIHLLDIRFPEAFQSIKGLQESSRFLSQAADGAIWMSHPYRGVFRISSPGTPREEVMLYDQDKGLPSALYNHVFTIQNTIIVAASSLTYHYQAATDRFVPNPTLNGYLDSTEKIRRLKELPNGDIWFISNTEVGVLKRMDKGLETAYEKIILPKVKRYMNNGWEKIFYFPELGVLVNAINGLLLYQDKPSYPVQHKAPVLLERLLINNDSILYPFSAAPDFLTLLPSQNTLSFRVAAVDFTNNQHIRYQYQLKGWDDTWTPFTEKRVKEYTNLPYRKFELRVRAQSPDGRTFTSLSFPFTIQKPWYLSTFALFSYSLASVLGLGGIFLLVSRRFKNLKQEFSTSVEKSNEAIRRLENIRIQAELDHKKRELVSTTIHITRQNETINAIQQMLTELKKEMKDSPASRKVNKIITYLKQEKRADEDWDQLLFHFKELHPSFFDRLKREHPALKPRDLKLCAYLKMNLSTKEMASLMNISIRGIEASRYRLRKRLGLDSTVNLNEYFMNY